MSVLIKLTMPFFVQLDAHDYEIDWAGPVMPDDDAHVVNVPVLFHRNKCRDLLKQYIPWPIAVT